MVIGGGKAIPSTINYRIQYIISSATIEGSQKEHQMFVCYMGNLILRQLRLKFEQHNPLLFGGMRNINNG